MRKLTGLIALATLSCALPLVAEVKLPGLFTACIFICLSVSVATASALAIRVALGAGLEIKNVVLGDNSNLILIWDKKNQSQAIKIGRPFSGIEVKP